MVSVRATLAASLVVIILGVISGPVRGQNNAAAIKQALIEKLATTGTWQARMKQTLTLPDLEPIRGKATLHYQKPDRLKIDFTEPQGQWLLLYETAGWYQKPGASRQAVDLPAEGGPIAMYQFLPRLLNGELAALAEGYREQTILSDYGFVDLVLEAEAPETQPARIRCRVDAGSLELQEIQLDFSTHEASLLMEFSDAVRDASLPPAIFKIPADAPDSRSKER